MHTCAGSRYTEKIFRGLQRLYFFARLCLLVFATSCARRSGGQTHLQDALQALQFVIGYESYVSNNWEIVVANADGSHPLNLTGTPTVQEHYPQISPDGARLCFSVDEGEGREAIRSLYVM